MTLPRMQRLLLAGALLLTPLLILAQEAPGQAGLEHQEIQAFAQSIDTKLNLAHMLTMRLIPLLFIVAMTALALLFASRRERGRLELIARFLDKGQAIPAALLPQPRSAQRDVRFGIWFASLGLALGLVLYIATGDLRVAAWCLILLFLAAASFLNALLLNRASSRDRQD
jgi:hypothetical protein